MACGRFGATRDHEGGEPEENLPGAILSGNTEVMAPDLKDRAGPIWLYARKDRNELVLPGIGWSF